MIFSEILVIGLGILAFISIISMILLMRHAIGLSSKQDGCNHHYGYPKDLIGAVYPDDLTCTKCGKRKYE